MPNQKQWGSQAISNSKYQLSLEKLEGSREKVVTFQPPCFATLWQKMGSEHLGQAWWGGTTWNLSTQETEEGWRGWERLWFGSQRKFHRECKVRLNYTARLSRKEKKKIIEDGLFWDVAILRGKQSPLDIILKGRTWGEKHTDRQTHRANCLIHPFLTPSCLFLWLVNLH